MTDADSTRDRLLDAAEVRFAADGFSAASIRDITALAGCNVAAVNYHFGGKENLYREVFRRRLRLHRERRVGAIQGVVDGARGTPAVTDILRAFVTAFLEPLLEGGEDEAFFSLMAREMHSPHLPPELLEEEMVEPVQASLAAAFVLACPHLDERQARLAVFSVVAQLIHVLHARRLLRHGIVAGAGVAELMDHIVDFSARALCATTGEGRS